MELNESFIKECEEAIIDRDEQIRVLTENNKTEEQNNLELQEKNRFIENQNNELFENMKKHEEKIVFISEFNKNLQEILTDENNIENHCLDMAFNLLNVLEENHKTTHNFLIKIKENLEKKLEKNFIDHDLIINKKELKIELEKKINKINSILNFTREPYEISNPTEKIKENKELLTITKEKNENETLNNIINKQFLINENFITEIMEESKFLKKENLDLRKQNEETICKNIKLSMELDNISNLLILKVEENKKLVKTKVSILKNIKIIYEKLNFYKDSLQEIKATLKKNDWKLEITELISKLKKFQLDNSTNKILKTESTDYKTKNETQNSIIDNKEKYIQTPRPDNHSNNQLKLKKQTFEKENEKFKILKHFNENFLSKIKENQNIIYFPKTVKREKKLDEQNSQNSSQKKINTSQNGPIISKSINDNLNELKSKFANFESECKKKMKKVSKKIKENKSEKQIKLKEMMKETMEELFYQNNYMKFHENLNIDNYKDVNDIYKKCLFKSREKSLGKGCLIMK